MRHIKINFLILFDLLILSPMFSFCFAHLGTYVTLYHTKQKATPYDVTIGVRYRERSVKGVRYREHSMNIRVSDCPFVFLTNIQKISKIICGPFATKDADSISKQYLQR